MAVGFVVHFNSTSIANNTTSRLGVVGCQHHLDPGQTWVASCACRGLFDAHTLVFYDWLKDDELHPPAAAAFTRVTPEEVVLLVTKLTISYEIVARS